ncbi:probable serine/threonine-protein kinase nek3 [Microplitis demolitor]|uniref:probable serine/threonine-protein kinase nek3 n=1 Tax=Microplitis demolitor TaxID=69319 RepID=UPI0006D5048F|nr:probable serine/threonine-protein kinase nek3 [Microplitis demolitor]
MKWKKGPSDFFPEKTFLIIKDNVESFSVKKSYRHIKSKSAADTGTWPPKVKKNSLFASVERPKTANLEKPSVLDPALVNKLDMSLLSKERLCDSMTRIQLDRRATASGGGHSMPVNNSNKNIHESIVESSKRSTPPFTEAKTFFIRSKRRSLDHLNNNNNNNYYLNTEQTMPRVLEPVIAKKSPSPVLKNNNNNNNNNNRNLMNVKPVAASSLSTVRTAKSSRLALPEELEVFTSPIVNKLKTPEPCKTCGRPDQPERFHSHPKGVPSIKGSTEVDKNSSKDVVRKSIQKPVALNYKSEKNKNKSKDKDNSNDGGMETVQKLSPRMENNACKSRPDSVKKGPRTVTCYICAREFGTASFPIHEPKCMEKWERENEALSPSQRRPRPQRPVLPLNHQQWNNVAWESSQSQLLPCWRCGRTFLPDRLPVHQKSCKVSKDPAAEKSDRSEKSRSITSRSGSSTVFCQTCGRNFGARTIKIHEPQCIKRWKITNNSYSPSHKNKSSSSYSVCSDNPCEQFKPTTTCYICGRDFGSASIDIHEPQCLKKWHIENDKLVLSKRRPEPIKPDIVLADTSDSASSVIDWAATTEARWKSHLGQLVPCKNCKRTFNPDRVTVHERTCKGIN